MQTIVLKCRHTIRHNSNKNYLSRSILRFGWKKQSLKFCSLERPVSVRHFSTHEITIFWSLKTKLLYICLKTQGIAVSVLKFYFIYLGLVFIGASGQELLQNLDPVARRRMYIQLLKLLNKRREQRK